MRAGLLRHRVTLQQPGGSTDAYGETVASWTDVGHAWAAIKPISAAETLQSQRQIGEVTHTVRMRWDASARPTAQMRIKLRDGRILNIVGAMNADERNRMVELLCREVV